MRKAQRVAVPGGYIEVGRHRVVVELGEEAHEVVRHIAPGRVGADDIGLQAVKGHHLAGGKAAVVQAVRRVGLGHRAHGRVNRVKAAVLLAPEHRAPGAVERLHRAVLLRQPAPEGLARRRAVTQHREVAAVFVVGLPSRHAGVLAIAPGDGLGDARALRAVAAAGKTVMPARAKAAHLAVGVDRQHAWVGVHQPFGRGGGRCAQHHLQAGRVQGANGQVQPGPVNTAWFGFDPAPGKFGNAHVAYAHRRHAGRVVGPPVLRPLLRVITNT